MLGRRQAALLALAALLLLSSTLQQATAQGSAAPRTTGGSGGSGDSEVVISELQVANKNTLKDEDGTSSDWIELHNTGTGTITLARYQLTDQRDGSGGWAFPPGISLAPGQYLLVFASGKDRTNPSAPLHISFKLSAGDGYLALLEPGGVMASAIQFPDMPTDVSFGLVDGVVSAAAESRRLYALLAAPTPGKANTGPRAGGPLVVGTSRTLDPRPTGGADIPVSTTVTPVQFPLAAVELVYAVGYGAEATLPMAASGDTYTTSIPASAATPGALLRWYVRASDTQGGVTRDPPFSSPQDRQYWGVVVADQADSSGLPVLELYCKDDKAPFSKNAVQGCSVWFNGTFYDNVAINRRGVTSLNWPKPKIKIESKQGSIFKIRPGMSVGELNLNSEWSEPGENTFMREPLAWEVFRQMGVTSLVSFHLHTRLNGQYFGKYAYVEQMDEDTLARWGYSVEPQAGPLWKSTSGEFSNLRWDIKPNDVSFYWQQYTRKGNNASEAQALVNFARGLAGGAAVPRSKFLFDALNLPQIVNHMAAQTVLLNQDRCTKNFYVYADPASQQWSMFPWDVESAFGIDRGLGGKPAPDYCILACEQWNSPLYCDANHPQDLTVKTPWGLISAQYDLYTTGRKLLASDGGQAVSPSCGKASGHGSGDLLVHASRKLLQDSQSVPQNGAAAVGLSLPATSAIPIDVDADLTKTASKTGAPGTFNHLIDAILAVPRTRQMYMRRLRTLMDSFVASGRLQGIVTAMYNDIRAEAKRDAQQWSNPGDPDRGYQQLTTEQMPIRKDQLFNQYGPHGPVPLIPDSQPDSFQLTLGQVMAGPAGSVEVVNPNDFAVDISGYRLQGAVQFTFAPGTVIPSQDSVYATASVAAFRQQRGGQGAFVVGPLVGQLLGAAASVQLLDDGGATVAST